MDQKKMDTYTLEYLERQLNNLSKLVEINSIINSTLDIGKLLTIIMEIIKDIMDAEASTLLLYEEETRDLVFKVALSDVGQELTERYRVRIGQGIAGWVAENRSTVYINDVYNDPRFDSNFDKKTGFKTSAILCCPLLFKGKLLGVIQAINPLNRQGFNDDDVVLFKAFANQAVLAVQNAIFFQNALEEERIKNELASAHSIQESLLPAVSDRYGSVLVAAKSVSAREVGGEFYDFFAFDNGVIGVALGDIHRKGIPGALYASIVSGAVKALSRIKGQNPSNLLYYLNQTLKDRLRTVANVSFFYGVVNGTAKELQFVNAGIAYPILVRDGVARYLKFGGESLGRDILAVKKVTVNLQPGDLFVIITDGIINLKNRKAQLFGLKRIMDFLSDRFEAPDEVVSALIRMADNFTEGLDKREDISVIAFMLEG